MKLDADLSYRSDVVNFDAGVHGTFGKCSSEEDGWTITGSISLAFNTSGVTADGAIYGGRALATNQPPVALGTVALTYLQQYPIVENFHDPTYLS